MSVYDLVSQMSPVLINDTNYLRLDDVVEAVALHLFPTGPATEEEMSEAVQKAKKALSELRYTPAGYLKPPTVPFSKRGEYYKGLPEITAEAVGKILEDEKTPSWEGPFYVVTQDKISQRLARYAFREPLVVLDDATKDQLRIDTSTHAQALGWTHKEDHGWTKPMPIDEDAAAEAADRFLRQCQGHAYIPNLHTTVLQAAYGRAYYNLDPLPKPIQQAIVQALAQHRYETEPDGEFYDVIMPELPADAEKQLVALFEDLTVYESSQYETSGLLFDDVRDAASSIASFPLTEWMVHELAKNGPIGRALMQLGYQTKAFTMDTSNMKPESDRFTSTVMPFFRREQHFGGIKTKEIPTIALAKGMTVRTPVVVLDDPEETIIAVQMIGPEQAVKANWAALMNGGSTNYIFRTRIKLKGAKSHITLKTPLPCGWLEWWLIHKQASAVAMSPEDPFYVLDDATAVPPPTFYFMLDRALQLPLQKSWSRDLWLIGRQQQLIRPATDSDSVGRGAWRVHPDLDAWSDIVQAGLKNGRFTF